MLSYYAQSSGWIYEIVLAEIIVIYCAYYASHMTFTDPRIRKFEMQNIKKLYITIASLFTYSNLY